jgi:hypothetical protein
MTSLVLAGNTSGTLTIEAPDSAGTSVLNLPASSGTILDDASVGVCRAWVNFDGTGTVAIRASFNVSGITDNGTGDYTVNIATAMVDADYSPIATSGDGASGRSYQATTTPTNASSFGLITVLSGNYAYEDAPYIFASIFR